MGGLGWAGGGGGALWEVEDRGGEAGRVGRRTRRRWRWSWMCRGTNREKECIGAS